MIQVSGQRRILLRVEFCSEKNFAQSRILFTKDFIRFIFNFQKDHGRIHRLFLFQFFFGESSAFFFPRMLFFVKTADYVVDILFSFRSDEQYKLTMIQLSGQSRILLRDEFCSLKNLLGSFLTFKKIIAECIVCFCFSFFREVFRKYFFLLVMNNTN